MPRTKEIWVVALAGEVDLDSAPRIVEQLERAVNAGASTVVVDLGAVTFLGSTGIALLVALSNQLTDADRSLQLTNLTPNIRRVLQITGLNEVFSVPNPSP